MTAKVDHQLKLQKKEIMRKNGKHEYAKVKKNQFRNTKSHDASQRIRIVIMSDQHESLAMAQTC